MKLETVNYLYNGKQYIVFIRYGNFVNINFRIKNNEIHISSPRFISRKKVLDSLEKFMPKLTKFIEKNESHYNFEEDYLYLLGKKYSLKELNIFDEETLHSFLMKNAKEVFSNLTRKYEEIMGIKIPYKIKVRKVSTRYGSNSLKTHSISYNLDLIHYSLDIISTVVVHELSHEFHRNHQNSFYNCVYTYCPNYKELQRKLKKGIHE